VVDADCTFWVFLLNQTAVFGIKCGFLLYSNLPFPHKEKVANKNIGLPFRNILDFLHYILLRSRRGYSIILDQSRAAMAMTTLYTPT